MADQSGNYTGAFLVAGGVGIISCVMPSFLLCLEDDSNEECKIKSIEEAKEANEDFSKGREDKLTLISNARRTKYHERELMFLLTARESDV